MAVSLPEGTSYPVHFSRTNHFFAVLHAERPQDSTQLLQNQSPVFSFSLLLPSLARLRILILLLMLMSGNFHPNPGPVFPCSVCPGNVTRRGRSVQCCARSKWVHFRCSLLFFSKFRALGSSHSWICPLLHPCFF